MSKTVQYFLSLQSPWTYLGHQRLVDLCSRCSATIELRPMNIAKLFPATGGLPLAKRSPQRQRYRLAELKRWHEYLRLPLNLHPAFFPVDERLAAGVVLAANEENTGHAVDLAGRILAAVWAEERNIADPETLLAIATQSGFDGEQLVERARQGHYDTIVDANTEQAIELGVFGPPTYVVDGEAFWGQDRLDFVERALG